MVTLATEKIFYNYIRKNPDLINNISYKFFENKDIQECYKLDLEFYNKYKTFPSEQQLSEIIKQKTN